MYENDNERHENPGRGLPLHPQRMSIESDVWVPLLQALCIAIAVALVAFALTLWLADEHLTGWARFGRAGLWFAGTFVGAFAATIVTFISQHRAQMVEPLGMLRDLIDAMLPGKNEDLPEPQYMVIRPRSNRPLLPATLDQEVRPVEPQVDPDSKELYDFITRIWPTGKVTREHCNMYGFTRAVWEKLVGGRRGYEGQESGRGVLDRAGVVRQTAAGWEICAPMNEALTITAPLEAYAQAKAQLVQLGTGRTGQDGTDPSPRFRRPSAAGEG